MMNVRKSTWQLLGIALLATTSSACPGAQVGMQGRHVRVENPTGWMMDWRQIQVFSGGTNIARGHGEMFTGTVWPDHNVKTRDGREMTDGSTDPTQRGPVFVDRSNDATGEKGMNPWFEVDLGKPVAIEKIVLYGSRWPERIYLDKGNRVVSILDENRRVVWCAKFDYYDGKTSPRGIFTFTPADDDKSPAVGTQVPEQVPSWVPMSWLLNADEIPPLPDAEQRMKRFAQRNSPAEAEKLAKMFVPLLDDRIPELKTAHQHFAAGRYQEALDAWKVYWFEKMKRVNLHWAFRGDYWTYPTNGDDLVNGIAVTISATSARAIRFTPGQIHWIDLPPRQDPGFRNAMVDCQQKAEVNKVSRPLLDAYRAKPDPKYLKCWAAIMDDWSLNFFEDASKCPYEVEDLFTFNPGLMWQRMMEDLSDLAVKDPQVAQLIPATTLARVQLTCLEKYTTAWWRQARETVFNHLNGGICLYYQVSFYIDEFHPGQRTRQEFRQAFERFMTLGTERDGSLTEIGDEGHQEIPIQQGSFFTHFEQTKPAWYTPGWRNASLEWYDNLFTYMFRHLAPGGYEHRFAVDYRPMRWTSTHKQYCRDRTWLPPLPDRDAAVFTPEVRRMLDAWGHISSGVPQPADPIFKPIFEKQQRTHEEVRKFLGDEKPGVPHLNSDWMPYTGAYYFRGGWGDDAPFMGMMACGSHGGSQAPQWPYSMIYHYDYNFPLVAARPVHIDGLQPQQLFGRMNCFQPGTKTMALTYADERPAPHRWLSNERFDFGEAVYHGGYQNYPGFKGDWDGPDLEQLDAGRSVADVHTIRQIIQLRGSRLFIVTDASKTPGDAAHEFSIPYVLSLSAHQKKSTKPFGPEQLEVDEKAGLLLSGNPDGPSVALHQFADTPFRYRREGNAKVDTRKYASRLTNDMGIAEQGVQMLFKGDRFALVSVISSIEKGGKERIASMEPLKAAGVVGFHAQLTDGGEIWYQTAGLGSARLACGPGTGTGQALLVLKEKKGLSGMVLGGKELALDGKPVKLANPDLQFVMEDGRLTTTDVLTPIDPVSFKPACNTFTGSEKIEMVSKTPNVEIRYTADGTPPTRASNLYTGPITITESTEFAARAYRLGPDGKPLEAEDFEINGTRFTVPSYGWFYKRPVAPPAPVEEKDLTPGLVSERLEAPWWRLYASAHWLPAAKAGTVEREMEGLQEPGPEPYGMRYKGYIRVPEDGVYTFHAPHEFVYMDGATSYDLRVYVDGEEWYLTQWWHGHGTWSVPLQKGYHTIQVDYADARTNPWRRSGCWRYYPRPWAVYPGKPSDLLISGPGLDRARIPKEWLFRKR